MPDKNVFQQSFWDSEESDAWDDLAEVILDIYFQGTDNGIEQLPPNVRVLADFDLVNTNAMDYARRYRYDLIRGITETTRQQTQKTVSDWISSGAPLDALENALDTIYGSKRAERIAVTEATRVYSEANAAAWQSTGLVTQFRFNTAVDDRVCPECGPLDGELFDIGDDEHTPPIHVSCRCYTTPVLDEDRFEELLEQSLNG